MSIVRIGLAETKKFAEGYEAIFGSTKKKNTDEKPAQAKDDTGKKAKAPKKKAKK